MKNPWSWLGVTALVIALGWGGFYGWQQKGALEGLRNELSDVRNQLANQNNSLLNQIGDNLGNFTSTNNQIGNIDLGNGANPTEKDTRILITANSTGFYDISGDVPGPGCSTDFNNDPATTTSVYTNVAKGISFTLPYNPKWGTSKYRINPYDRGTIYSSGAERIVFGKIAPFEGCLVVRDYVLEFLSAKSASQLTSNIAKDELNHGIITKQLNGLQVVEYTGEGLCSYPTVIVIGQKFNYQFNYICGGTFADLENIAKTVKLL